MGWDKIEQHKKAVRDAEERRAEAMQALVLELQRLPYPESQASALAQLLRFADDTSPSILAHVISSCVSPLFLEHSEDPGLQCLMELCKELRSGEH